MGEAAWTGNVWGILRIRVIVVQSVHVVVNVSQKYFQTVHNCSGESWPEFTEPESQLLWFWCMIILASVLKFLQPVHCQHYSCILALPVFYFRRCTTVVVPLMLIFGAQCIAFEHSMCYCCSVCPSVCLSPSWSMWKWPNISSQWFATAY